MHLSKILWRGLIGDMPKSLVRLFEILLLLVVGSSISLGVNWLPSLSATGSIKPTPLFPSQAVDNPLPAANNTNSTPNLGADLLTTTTPVDVRGSLNTGTPNANDPTRAPLSTSVPFTVVVGGIDANDAPLIEQPANTINILLLGSDASADQRLARTDSLMIASINPDAPSVSLLSFPRDLQVRIPGWADDRINTVFERGYMQDFPGGGPAFLALALRKNFGIKIDHFVRIDFQGFIKAIDTLGGVDVLAECELHDTFPDKASPTGRTDLDIYPGKVSLSGKQALWYSRSRWSTTDFDRARRQQKVMRAVLRKARESNMLQNAIGLYGDFRNNLETDLSVTDLPTLMDIAQRLGDLQIKNRVITYPIVRSFKRDDGAQVLLSTNNTIPYIKEALSPPAGNRAQTLPRVEVRNGSNKPDMELIASERLTWEGFQVVAVGKTDAPSFKETQIIDFSTTPKGSPITRLSEIFRVQPRNILGQPDPSSVSVARIALGDDYNSCPATASIASDVPLAAEPTKAP